MKLLSRNLRELADRPAKPAARMTGYARAVLISMAAMLVATAMPAADWKVDTIDQSGPGKFTSMKVDAQGNVHVVFVVEGDGHPLKYSYWDHTLDKWFTMQLAANASFCTLTLDSKQRPRISYSDQGTFKGAKLRFLYWEGGAEWKNVPVSPINAATVSYYTSIALDAQDRPFFSYYDYLGPDGEQTLRLRSVSWADNHWEVRVVDGRPGSGKFNSIAVDSAGNPHIAYANVKAETMSLRYASWDGENWRTETLEGAQVQTGMWSVSMILDKNDNPHIAYTDVSHRLVKYATRKNGVWQFDVVDQLVREGYPDRNGIALDSEGNPYVSYYDYGRGILKVAFRKNGRWYVETLAGNYAGYTSSLQIHDGMLWISFCDDGSGAVKVARRPLETPLVPPPPPPSGSVAKAAGK
jgi:hypothetical protein